MSTMGVMHIGKTLRAKRTERFMTQEEFAKFVGLSRDHLGRIERNEGSTPWNRGRGLNWTTGGSCGTLVWSLNSKQEVSPHGPALPMVSQPTLPCLRSD
jgi:Helix-turn-helix